MQSIPVRVCGALVAGVLAAGVLAAGVLAAGPAAGSTFTVIYGFSGGADGGNPGGPLLRAADGTLYGTASAGGQGNGVVFRLAQTATLRWSESVVYVFPARPRASVPQPGLAMDGGGALYGTTDGSETGSVFRLAPQPAAPWHFSTLYRFPGPTSPRGGGPAGVLTVDRAGDVLGVTEFGGEQSGQYPCLCGVVYALPYQPGGRARSEAVLYTFHSLPDGNFPATGLTPGSDGALYGTTSQGGFGQCLDGSDVVVVGCGTVFRLTQAAAGWTETQLYSFTAHEQNQPTDPLAVGPDGALYGTAGLDVFRLAPDPAGTAWRKRTVYSFPGGIAGTIPTGGVLFDPQGNMYGATRSFGVEGPATVFRLAPPAAPDQPWTLTTLATVAATYADNQPVGGLARTPDGTLYGAAGSDAANNGFIYAVTP